MRTYGLIILAIVGVVFTTHAQQKKNKNAKVEVEVNGNCDMCKKRIEKAAFGVKGVKTAQWNAENQKLIMVLDENRTDALQVQKVIAATGHDTKEVKSSEEAYDGLHFCCKYDRSGE